MKFDFAIGNPAYNADFSNSGENGNFAAPIYNKFLDEAVKVADKVEMIHPARFLFNAGSTPKEWNEKMLNNPHFKILSYEADSSKIFTNTDIKGGVAISYSDSTKNYGVIGTFTPFPELNGIVKKSRIDNQNDNLSSIIYTQVRFDLDELYKEYPEYKALIGSNGKDKRFRNNAFEKISVFSEMPTANDDIKVIGVLKNKRTWRYIPSRFVDKTHENLKCWKVLCPRANGAGIFGEVLSPLVIGEPNIGYTQTFIGIGAFKTRFEAEAAEKYIKSKFTRSLLDVLKVTQDNDRGVWKLIPLQDFTSNSDINWNTSIKNIDKQLYKKYGLTQEEIDFIETHVKEME